MEIQVEDYVRSKVGIGKIVKIFEYEDGHKDYYTDTCIDDEDNSTILHIHQILKHSKNIIDLIEVGDYVNGKEVIHVLDGFADGTMEIELSNHRKIYRAHIEEIKSIVTHEGFKQVEYEV